MKINIKRLEDAVPEAVEMEFVYESMISSVIVTLEQADAIQQALVKVLKEDATPTPNTFGISEPLYNLVVSLIKGNQFIQAIKEVRADTGLGLKEAKDLCDNVRAELRIKGECA